MAAVAIAAGLAIMAASACGRGSTTCAVEDISNPQDPECSIALSGCMDGGTYDVTCTQGQCTCSFVGGSSVELRTVTGQCPLTLAAANSLCGWEVSTTSKAT